MKILLVEDSATLRHAVSGCIVDAGHEPILATCGEEALQIAEHTRVDMIIMDVEMPGLDGFDTTRLIREWLGDHWIPIIFLTGKSDAEDLQQGIEAGGDDYLIKPVNSVILQAKIRAMQRIIEMRDQMAQMNRELTKLSQIDGLTGLYNRRTFEVEADKLWRHSARSKAPLAVMLMDVDHFKAYNDFYGHPAGDQCLRAVGRVLSDCIHRPGDRVGRYGGEEFVALLTDTDQEGAMHVAEDIRRRVEELYIKHRASPSDSKVTLSIGVSTTTFTTGTSLAKQIQRADKALYLAKQKGRNRVELSSFGPQGNIMVVDQDKHSLDNICSLLRGHCGIVHASSADECLHLLEEMTIDVVMVSADMEDESCIDLCKSLRADTFLADIPVLIYGQGSQEELQEVVHAARANAGIEKPSDPHRLIALVDQYLI